MERLPTYEQLYASFRWNIPARYNIAADVCDRHAADASKDCADRRGRRRQDLANDLPRHTAQSQSAGQSLGLDRPGQGRQSHGVARPKSVDRHRPCRMLESRLGIGAGLQPCLPPTRSLTGSIMSAPRSSSPIRQTFRPPCGRGRWPRRLSASTSSMVTRPKRESLTACARSRTRCLHQCRYCGGRSCLSEFHLRHHRQPKRRAAGAPIHARPSAGSRVRPRFLSAAGRRHVVAGGLGVARRPDGCADARLVSRRPGTHLPGTAFRSRTGFRDDRPPPACAPLYWCRRCCA